MHLSMELVYRVRQATADDKQAVLKLQDNVYNGLDYLPEYYDYFQTSDHTTPYVFTENDRIIAYLTCSVVDNGETIVTRAGRVCPSHQGRHLYGRFVSEVEKIQGVCGRVKRHTLIKTVTPSSSFLNSYKPVATKAIHMYEYNNSSVSTEVAKLTSNINSHARVLENIPEEFLQPNFSSYLFPEGLIIVDWVPFQLLQTNIPLLKGRNTVFYSDISLTEAGEFNMTKQQTGDTIKIQGLLSASTIFKAHLNLDICCNLDIFGSDFRTLYSHIIFHLMRVYDTVTERVNLRVCTSIKDGTCETSSIHSVFEKFGMKALTSETRNVLNIKKTVYVKDMSNEVINASLVCRSDMKS